jgi:hypothetical protein
VTVLNQQPIKVIRTTYSVRMRRGGKATPLSDIADTPRYAKELAEAKARTYNLPIMYLDYRQDFAKQVDDGVYVVETRTTDMGVSR